MPIRPTRPTCITAALTVLGSVTVLGVLLGASAGGRQLSAADVADTVLLGGQVLTVDSSNRVAEALAIRGGRIMDVGTSAQIKQHVGPQTEVIPLAGRTVIPGIVAAHCHAIGVARGTLDQPHAELLTIAEVQDWIRRRAKEVPPGTWLRVPRTDITRLRERRHPTRKELDTACTSHPVIFTAARKHALNSRGFELAGVAGANAKIPGGSVIYDGRGQARLIAGGNAHLRQLIPRPEYTREELLERLAAVHRHYNAVGITSIFERAGGSDDLLLYRELQAADKLNVRVTQTFRSQFRSPQEIQQFTQRVGVKTGDGDDWVRVGPLKIVVDGGIHWGNTFLREPYGSKRSRFYVHEDPRYRGDLHYSVELMSDLFAEAHRLGWQWCCHVTGDAGVDRVLDALQAAARAQPDIVKRRFTLTHAYFPAVDAVQRARQLGVCVDTQPSLYYKDSAAIFEIYGAQWAERFIGLGDWLRGGIPTAIAGDHMVGLDPDRAMNAYNPFLMLYVAVTRKNRDGQVYGRHQRIRRAEALRCVTANPAFLAFDEDERGSLQQGRLADLAVLDRDYLNCPADEIRRIQVQLTMVNGKVVFRRGDSEDRPATPATQ